VRYTGGRKTDVREERRDVHCLRASLSEQDLEREGGASPREGLRRTIPRWEKKARPGRVVVMGLLVVWGGGGEGLVVLVSVGGGVGERDGGTSQGEASGWADMMSSMLASPPGECWLFG
jgi:hypothetical protein